MLTRLYAAAMVLVVLNALSGCSLATLPLYTVDRKAFNGERAEAPSYWPQGWPRIWFD